MAFLGREQPVMSGSAANVCLISRVCSLLLTVWALAGRATINISFVTGASLPFVPSSESCSLLLAVEQLYK